MKMKTRIAILAAAVLLTLAGFNMIVTSSTLDLMRAGRLGGYEVIVTASAQGSPAHHPMS
jgi:hypothetical protein